MKKIIFCFCVICVLTGAIFIWLMGGFKTDSYQQEFLVANNENHVFDNCFNGGSYAIFSVPEETPSIPFEDISVFESLECVDQVYPYYPLVIKSDENNLQVLQYWTENQDDFKQIIMPIEDPYDDGTPYLWKDFYFRVVTDYQQFHKVHDNTMNEIYVKKFDTETGIYISDTLYEQLQIDQNATQLFIEVPVSVPVIAEMKNEIFDNSFEYQHYTPVFYEVVHVTLEVQGVLNQSYTDVMWCYGNGIVVPYELTKSIFNTIDFSSYSLQTNQTYWRPNTYIVKCKEGIDRKTFTSEAILNYESFYVDVYDYGLERDPFYYLYTKEDVLTW